MGVHMFTRAGLFMLALGVAVAGTPVTSSADLSDIAPLLKCQTRIAKQGARYANKVIKSTLKCTSEIVECQVNCDEGVYGPSCIGNPPPCCDSDDRMSNASFDECMDDADFTCSKEDGKIASAELRKRDSIFDGCADLTTEQLCGAETPGLNFITMNAGCEALIPGYVCGLLPMLDCVGGPLEQDLAEKIGGLLSPRSGEALAAVGSTGFAGIARTHKFKDSLPSGKVDIWSIDGTADEEIRVRVKTTDDAGGLSTLHPVLTYVASDGSTAVANTNVLTVPCSTANTCGEECPMFKRRFPFTGTFFLEVKAETTAGCGGGSYQLVVTTEGASAPVLAFDNIDSPITP